MKRILTFISVVALALSACHKEGNVESYTAFLLDNMSSADKIIYSRQFWTDNVEKTLEVRKKMGWKISERDFRYFVLPSTVVVR